MFSAMMWDKLCEMFFIATSLSWYKIYGHCLTPSDSILFEQRNKPLPLHTVRRFDPQNRDRIVATDYCYDISPYV